MMKRLPGRPPREHDPVQRALISFPLHLHEQLRLIAEINNVPMTKIVRDGTQREIAMLLSQITGKIMI